MKRQWQLLSNLPPRWFARPAASPFRHQAAAAGDLVGACELISQDCAATPRQWRPRRAQKNEERQPRPASTIIRIWIPPPPQPKPNSTQCAVHVQDVSFVGNGSLY